MKIIKPKKLEKGDSVGIIAPSEAISNRNALKSGVRILENQGFKVVLGRNIFKRHSDYMAGTDKQRANDLNKMFANKKIKAIFCLVGGSSANRLLPLIDFNTIKKNPKIFVGFSDITTLLIAIYTKTGLVTFYGPNITSGYRKEGIYLSSAYTLKNLLKLLMNSQPFGQIHKKTKWQTLKKGGIVSGRLLGGNLEVFLNLSGTEFFPKLENSIFFWEELGEGIYDIDFFLNHLRLIKDSNKIKGMLIGKIIDLQNIGYKNTLSFEQTLIEIFKDFDFPIVYNADFGHIKDFATLPIGIKAKLDSNKATLEILESAVI